MQLLKPLTLALLAASIAACSTSAPTSPTAAAPKPAAATPNNEDWYQVRTETQLFVFDDYNVFRSFLTTGKAPYLKETGQKDKNGRDIVLALRAEDQGKDLKTIAAYQFLTISLTPAEKFYGEMRQDGRIYVFSRYGDMIDMNRIGEPTFSFNDIGGGPQGERVVYVLGKEEPKPEKQIALFKTKYQ
ncbi:hypothetical protein NVV93_03235 [Pseudomonas sp. LS44]|uniref:hypothetical protein n=1 Tax=Pseudomonas sp. LS44 TaxID=1357074 RepID=UPI00215A336F|nr:hypothetical protein [Pseudomonas sp. LS44]UVE18433.1 hypothetical protein NVV93_03235 [Pseudomonas sp. LS44]